MSLKNRIFDDMKTALKGSDKPRLAAIRLLMAAIKQKEVDERITLDDSGVISVIEKMLKQRRDSIAQYTAAKRMDLADAENFEVDVLTAYMPQALTEAEIAALIEAAVKESGANAANDMGKVITLLKPRLAGRADMGEVSRRVKTRLAGS